MKFCACRFLLCFTIVLTLLILLPTMALAVDIPINSENFPDANFRDYLVDRFSDELSPEEVAATTEMDVSVKSISNLRGIEHFTALTSLTCNNNQLTTLDVSKNTALIELRCDYNDLTALDVSNKTALTSLICRNNKLTSLDVSDSTALNYLACNTNNLTSLNITSNTALEELICNDNSLGALNVSNNTKLKRLTCYNDNLTTLDVSNNTALTYLSCHNNKLTTLDVSNNTALDRLLCYTNNIDALDVSNNTALTTLYCSVNNLTALDVSRNTSLTTFDCSVNNLTALDVSKNTSLTKLDCSVNNLTALDVSNNTALIRLYCSNNSLMTLDVSKNTALLELYCSNNSLIVLDISHNTALTTLYCQNNYITNTDDLAVWFAAAGHSGQIMPQLEKPIEYILTVDLNGGIGGVTGGEYRALAEIPIDAGTKEGSTFVGWVSSNGGTFDDYGSAITTFTMPWNDTTITAFWESADDPSIDAANFPDESFRNWLIEQFGDTLSPYEINTATTMIISDKGISDLKGIEYFVKLKYLYCGNNNLTTLDVSNNTALEYLYCPDNSLTTLDVSNNTALEYLYCHNNSLTTLDVSNNTALIRLYCDDNYITNTAALEAWLLEDGHSGSVQPQKLIEYTLTVDLNGVSGGSMSEQYTAGTRVPIDAGTREYFEFAGWTSTNGGAFDDETNSQTYFTMPANNTTITASWVPVGDPIPIDAINFPDEKFRAYLTQELGLGDTLMPNEIAATTQISIDNMNISDLKGIEYFVELETLYCRNNSLVELDVSKNAALTGLDCTNNKLVELNVSKNTALTGLDCTNNKLVELDVSKNTALTHLYCNSNNLTALGVSNNTALINLTCNINSLTELDVSNNTALTYLQCSINSLTELDVSNNTALTTLSCYSNNLTSLDVTSNTELKDLRCYSNNLVSLDVSNNTALTILYCHSNGLTTLDVSQNVDLINLRCDNNYISDTSALETWLAQGGHTGTVLPQKAPVTLTVDYGGGGQTTSVKYPPGVKIAIDAGTRDYYVFSMWTSSNGGTFVDASAAATYFTMPDNDTTITANWTLADGVITIDETNFPDVKFRDYLTQKYGNALSDDDIANIKEIDVYRRGISTLKGIELFTALESLDCSSNNLVALDVSKNTALTNLICYNNKLTALNVSSNAALTGLNCSLNNLTALNVSSNTALTNLDCGGNNILELDVSKNTALTGFKCYENDLSVLNVSSNTELTTLDCGGNSLSLLDVSENPALIELYCHNNNLLELDVSKNIALTELSCSDNYLTALDISGKDDLGYLYCQNNYISDTAALEAWLAEDGHDGDVLPQYAVGDANADGYINNRDVVTILKWSSIADFSPNDDQLMRGDVNGDKTVNRADAEMLIKRVAGLDG